MTGLTREEVLREQKKLSREEKKKIERGYMRNKYGTPARRDERFDSPELLEHIWNELDKDHKLDNREKLAVFIIAVSAYLPAPEEHCSAALKGDSSSGKDNLIRTVLKHVPKEDAFFLTRGTSAAIEDEAENVKILAFSEINKHREGGANSEMTETFKQLSEGGTAVLKKDAATGFRTTKHVTAEQKTLLYGTTETQTDDELETRYVVIPVKGGPKKNKIVIADALLKASSPEHYLKKTDGNSWIAQGIKALDPELQPILPYAEVLDQPAAEGGEAFFDYGKERVKRDVKRLLNLTKTVTWLFQDQRTIIEIEGKRFVLSEPSDFKATVEIFIDFFNLSYSGLDHRLQTTLEVIKECEGRHDADIMAMGFDSKYYGYAVRHLVQELRGIQDKKTIKEHIDKLKDFGYIADVHYDRLINPKAVLVRTEGGNQGGNRGVLGRSSPPLPPGLDPWFTPEIRDAVYKGKEIRPICLSFLEERSTPAEIPPRKIPPRNPASNTRAEPLILSQSFAPDGEPLKVTSENIFIENEPNFLSPEGLLGLIRTLGEAEDDALKILYPVPERTEWLNKLSREGAICERRAGLWVANE